jgi:hypothetical protein
MKGGATSGSALDDASCPVRYRSAVAKLLFRYASVPMSLTDVYLVRMAERYLSGIVMTLGCDFRIYRKHGRQVIPVKMPNER